MIFLIVWFWDYRNLGFNIPGDKMEGKTSFNANILNRWISNKWKIYNFLQPFPRSKKTLNKELKWKNHRDKILPMQKIKIKIIQTSTH